MKKKCRVLDCTGERTPVLDAADLQNEAIECLYLFGTCENMRQAFSVLCQQNVKRKDLRVVAVMYGQPCGDLPCVDRWVFLSRETMPAASVRDFLRQFRKHLQEREKL